MIFFKKYKFLFLQLLFAVCLLPAMIFAYRRPHYNMDMLSYMAIILEMDRGDTTNIHRDVYEVIRREVPDPERGFIINSPGHREKMMNDASFFRGQLPFYRVKPLYTGFSYLLFKAGFSLTKSTSVPSVVAFFLIGMLLFYWLNRHHNPVFSVIMSLLIMYSGFMISVSRVSSPDCLSAFFLLAAFYFILEKPSTTGMLLAFLLAVFTRMDNVVTALMVITILAFSRRWQRKISMKIFIAACLVILGSYFLISSGSANGEWSLWYYPDFMRRFNTAQEVRNSFSFSEYFALLYSKAITGVVFSHLSLFVLLAVFILYDAVHARKLSFEQFLILGIWSIMFVRFILFPDVSDRFYIAFYLVIAILFARKYIPGKIILITKKYNSTD